MDSRLVVVGWLLVAIIAAAAASMGTQKGAHGGRAAVLRNLAVATAAAIAGGMGGLLVTSPGGMSVAVSIGLAAISSFVALGLARTVAWTRGRGPSASIIAHREKGSSATPKSEA